MECALSLKLSEKEDPPPHPDDNRSTKKVKIRGSPDDYTDADMVQSEPLQELNDEDPYASEKEEAHMETDADEVEEKVPETANYSQPVSFRDKLLNADRPPADDEDIQLSDEDVILGKEDAITPEDVVLKPDMPYFRSNTTERFPRITYLHIFGCPKFSMGIFCLPPSGVIPLHNHPGMTVFSKLLFGTMHIKSYDWVVDLPPQTPTSLKPTEIQSSEVRLAKVKVDADFTAPCSPSILYPADGGNMHCFTAVTACAVLDVLGPPYSDPDGRHCTYYLNYPFSNFSVDGTCRAEEEKKNHEWLQEREKPEDLEVVGTMYGGPKIVEG